MAALQGLGFVSVSEHRQSHSMYEPASRLSASTRMAPASSASLPTPSACLYRGEPLLGLRRVPVFLGRVLLVLSAFVLALALVACASQPGAGISGATTTPPTQANAGGAVTTPTATKPVTTEAATGTTAASPIARSVFPLKITDDVGRQVTIKSTPRKIVSLTPAHTETLYALGLADRVVGVDEYSNYPADAQSKPKVGAYAQISVEKVVALGPDLVLADTIHKQVVPELERQGIAVVVLMPGNIEAVLKEIETVGQITGQQKEADALVSQMRKRIAAVEDKLKGTTEKPRVFYEIDETLFTAGPGSFIDDVLTRAGGANVAADAGTPWPQLTLEALVAKDPQVVLLADKESGQTPEVVKARPGWAGISAVKEGRVVNINPDLCSRPGPRVVDGLEEIARALHPELFPQG